PLLLESFPLFIPPTSTPLHFWHPAFMHSAPSLSLSLPPLSLPLFSVSLPPSSLLLKWWICGETPIPVTSPNPAALDTSIFSPSFSLSLFSPSGEGCGHCHTCLYLKACLSLSLSL